MALQNTQGQEGGEAKKITVVYVVVVVGVVVVFGVTILRLRG